MKRILWREGLFMQAHHLQKQDYLWMAALRESVIEQGPYAYGLKAFSYTKSMLAKGEVVIEMLEGIMPDGTPFHLSGQSERLSCSPQANQVPAYIALTLPHEKTKGIRVAEDFSSAKDERYVIEHEYVSDEMIGEQELLEIEVLVPHYRLRWIKEGEEAPGLLVLPLLKVLEVRENGEIIVDDHFIPPVLSLRVHPTLNQVVKEVSGFLSLRRNTLLERISGVNQYGVAGITELLLLQLINRYAPTLQHYREQTDVHPEKIFLLFLQLAGELRTFTSEDRGYAHPPLYQHRNLAASFGQLMEDLRAAFNYVFDEPAILLPFETYKYNLYLAQFDKLNFDYARLVLGVKADMPLEQLRNLFPTHVKLGPTEMIRDLVNLQIPGLPVHLLPVAPRQIPYHSGFLYFELDNQAELWLKLREAPGLALHLGGSFPGVELELWAIKD